MCAAQRATAGMAQAGSKHQDPCGLLRHRVAHAQDRITRSPGPRHEQRAHERRRREKSTYDAAGIISPPFCSGFLRLGNALGQTPQLGAIEDLGVDHAHQQRLDGALAEPVHDALDGAARPRAGGIRRGGR